MLVMRTTASQRGITIIELMIAIVVLVLLIGLGAPSYSQWLANSQTRNAAESLQNGLRLAQAEAARRNTQVDLVLTDDAPTSATVTSATTGRSWIVRVPGATPELIQGKPAGEGSQAVQVASDAATISFNGLGRLTPGSAAVTIDFTNPAGNRPLRVTASLGGRVRMCDPAFASSDPRGC
jgi:type IV fimbrial biogenesis protein FimT